MTIDRFLPVAVIIGGIIVGSTLLYTICYAFHVKVIQKFGAWWAWPLLTLYAVCGVISLGCAILEWNGFFERYQYGFYGDYDNARRGWSFALLGVLSIFLFLSARHAGSVAKGTKAKS